MIRSDIKFKNILSQVKFKDWNIVITRKNYRSEWYLQVQFQGRCADTGDNAVLNARKWLLSPHMCESEVVGTAFLAVQQAASHEVREHFTYKGQKVYGPHFDVTRLAEFASDPTNYEYRKEPEA